MSVVGKISPENWNGIDSHTKYVGDEGNLFAGSANHKTIAKRNGVGSDGGSKPDNYTIPMAGQFEVDSETIPPIIHIFPGSLGCDTDPLKERIPLEILQKIVGNSARVVIGG